MPPQKDFEATRLAKIVSPSSPCLLKDTCKAPSHYEKVTLRDHQSTTAALQPVPESVFALSNGTLPYGAPVRVLLVAHPQKGKDRLHDSSLLQVVSSQPHPQYPNAVPV